MSVRTVTIDKTAPIEEMLPDCLAVCLSGMPGMGRKTAARMLLERHPEVNAVFCSIEEIEDRSAIKRRRAEGSNWYLIRKPENSRYPDSNEGFWQFIRSMPKTDRIILAVDGLIPESFLELVWSGVMGVVMPESFWFTEAETYRYLKECRSGMRYREVYYLTGGWAGCIAMMVRLEMQLADQWSARELSSRYEIRKYIKKILDTLPEDELNLLRERAAFPGLNKELTALLWGNYDKDLEERLFVRGALVYVPESDTWHVQPALRIAMGDDIYPQLCEKAITWYEQKGQIQNALICCWNLHDRQRYTECLIRNYDRIPFLNYERDSTKQDRHIIQLLYLEWMELFLRQDKNGMDELRGYIKSYAEEAVLSGADIHTVTEICLNIAYTDPAYTTEEWMEMLRKETDPAHPIRLYFILGESVSYLSGLRDLSELFACEKSKRNTYHRLWKERLVPENQSAYRMAELEYIFQTDGGYRGREGKSLEMLPEIRPELTWQERLGMMYLAYLISDEDGYRENVQKYIRKLVSSLEKEDNRICRWNVKALYYLAEAKWGEKENLMKWIRETGGDIENELGKTKFYMAAEVKINLYLGNYGRAGELLQLLVPYFENGHSWRWLAESLFQRAVAEKEKGESGAAFKSVAESISIANPFRYVRFYTGYGRCGAELLNEYREWLEKSDQSRWQNKKRYKYGSVLRMPLEDWISYVARRAGRKKKSFLDLRTDQQNIYHAEKLTVTEQMVLHYLEKGYSNAQIGREMNIKVPTVKTHIYNIYKKLGVTTRVQAVQKMSESRV